MCVWTEIMFLINARGVLRRMGAVTEIPGTGNICFDDI